MSQNSEQLTVALSGHVWVAPYSSGLTLPEDLSTPDAAFVDLGYTSEDGVTFTATPNVEDIMAWQKATPVRRLVTSREVSVAFTLLQTNLDTFALAFGGGDWSEPTAGIYRYDPPADADALAEYACVIDFQDGDRNGRLVVMRASVNESVETQMVRNAPMQLPVTLAALTPDEEDAAWYFVSDDAAYEPVT